MACVRKIKKIDECVSQHLFDSTNIAFGVFDGVHVGHVSLISSVIDFAKAHNANLVDATGSIIACSRTNVVILTFDKDPDEVLFPKKTKKLQTNEERIFTLAKLPVDEVIVLPFTKSFASMQPNEFLTTLFGCGANKADLCINAPASIHVGQGFRFGRDACGCVQDMQEWGRGVGCSVVEVPLVSLNGKIVSSTRIRYLLSNAHVENNLEVANSFLNRRFSLSGVVQEGRHEGTSFGFATANLCIGPDFEVLESGVYAALAHVANMSSQTFIAAVNVGVSPTFNESTANIEAHILDFEGDLYGKTLTLDFVKYLRPMKKFSTTDELIKTVSSDIAQTRKVLKNTYAENV